MVLLPWFWTHPLAHAYPPPCWKKKKMEVLADLVARVTNAHARYTTTHPLRHAPFQLARDLIPRMLVVDPMKRITIPEIRRHPWFTHKLPMYLSRPPSKIEKEVSESEGAPQHVGGFATPSLKEEEEE